jgi:DNA-directed RNA polymerase subunit beta
LKRPGLCNHKIKGEKMADSIKDNFRFRESYGEIPYLIDIPNLIEIQKRSYERFLQKDIPPNEREDIGLQGIFKSIFPIQDFNLTSELQFVSYSLERPKYDAEECKQRGMTYAAPLKVTIQLIIYDIKESEEGEKRRIRDIKEQEVFFGEMPLMTETGTFIINGTERVVVSQLHRSPGVFFEHNKGKLQSAGKILYSARLIPYRGSWLEFEFDHKDLIYVRIDRRRKFLATVLLKALGYSSQELLAYFYDTETIFLQDDGKFRKELNFNLLLGQRATRDIMVQDEVVVKKNRKFTEAAIKKLKQAKVTSIPIDLEELTEKISAEDVFHPETGEVILECNEKLTKEKIKKLRENKINSIKVLFIDILNVGPYLRDTLAADKTSSPEEALLEIYRRLRPGDPSSIDVARNLFHSLFFDPARYDLSQVGRLKLNYKFKLNEPLDNTVLTPKDILETVRHLIELKNGRGSVDDIDHLGNRRVRTVGEILENQYRIGLTRMERAVKERMNMSQDIDTLMPHDLINTKPVSAAIKEYFTSSQLSQFMDQTNPLSEITHKRRLSALGPSGLSRERAGFEVRDVHTTHYGRICPIETPEGPNVGLIVSLSTYSRINEFGFVETPYRVVKDGKVKDEIRFYSALEEEGHYIAQANAPLNPDGTFKDNFVAGRYNGEFVMAKSEEITLMDVSPNQVVSVAASLIPFLEHDDANRALMGSNMQRQAVPLLKAKAPLIGTGMERIVARDSGATIIAKCDGIVESVDATRIVVKPYNEDIPHIYTLTKFHRSNQNTLINQKPIVKEGDHIKKGEIIADGASTEKGELALGQNVLVAFMPWGGYNFEDSILISERLLKEDTYTSIHIEEFECVTRDTKLGKEEITRDIPNVGEEMLKNLDENGIVRIGVEVKTDDILVGKITPKGETQLSPEEKLLRAIFGEKAGDMQNTSLRVPHGISGTVIDVKVYTRRGIEKDDRAKDIEAEEQARLEKDQRDEIKIIQQNAYQKIKECLLNQTTTAKFISTKGKIIVPKGEKLREDILDMIPPYQWKDIPVKPEQKKKIEEILNRCERQINEVEFLFAEKISSLTKGDELPPGVIKMIKVYIAVKRKLAVGDKIAGRHGNKGVISMILPEEDMPFLKDGTPIDIVLSPLGVPSRMNVGQILETHLGWAARELGRQLNQLINHSREKLKAQLKQIFYKESTLKLIDELSDESLIRFAKSFKDGVYFGSPVFDGIKQDEIRKKLQQANLPSSGQTILYDGRTGEPFDGPVTVGIMYMMKLHHLVEDKIHARSIGPYSLVTQQPLGGKAQFGGQRLGEMEVWAIEAYGAAYSLQEFLTVKSDDVLGRIRMYEGIVKGNYTLEPGLPESFNVLIRELQSLCLDVELLEEPPKPKYEEEG